MLYTLTSAVRRAGEILLQQHDEPRNVKDKGGEFGIVTDADLASEESICRVLRKEYQGIPIVAEESWTDQGLPTAPFFALDGLDGTGNYAQGTSFLWGISLAYINELGPQCGVVFLPAYRTLLDPSTLITAERGKGCWMNGRGVRLESERQRRTKIFAYDAVEPEAAPLSDGLDTLAAAYDRSEKRQRPMRMGASVAAFAGLLKRRADAYANLHRATSIWDLAAGVLAVQEAGGASCAPDGSPLRWDSLRMNSVSAESSALLQEILPITRPLASFHPGTS